MNVKNFLAILALGTLMFTSCKKDSGYETVNDACGNSYRVVSIDGQYWLEDNIRCNKYDTESEMAGSVIATADSETEEPYYTNYADTINWSNQPFAGKLSDDQKSKLGYLYNWAAAMGYKSAAEASSQTWVYVGSRQGVCPNGFRIPTANDFKILSDCYGADDKSGAVLKTRNGWYGVNTSHVSSVFAALPAGYADGKDSEQIGYDTHFISADAYKNDIITRTIVAEQTTFLPDTVGRVTAYSVRCIKK